MKLKKSRNLRMVSGNDGTVSMAYHKLFGNPRILNREGVEFLNLFENCIDTLNLASHVDGSPDAVLSELVGINYLIPDNFDEQSLLDAKIRERLSTFRLGKTLSHIGLSISNACNFGCQHCIFFDRNKDRKQDPQMMTWDMAKKCVDIYLSLLRQHGQSCGQIVFGNAEPLLNWEVLRKTLEYCEEISDVSFDYAINTNLSLLTRDIAETLKHCRVRIATSLDGPQDVNDLIRVTKGGHGTFCNINRQMDILEAIKYPLEGISITITRKNYDLIDLSMIDYALNRGMTRVACDFDLVNLQDIPINDRISKIIEFKNYGNRRGIVISGTWSRPYKRLIRASELSEQDAFCAAAAGRMIVFDDDGTIKACGYGATRIGHVDSIEDLFSEEGAFYRLVESRIPGNNSLCKGCDIEGQCAGQCLTTIEAARERPALIGDMCEFYRKITDALIQDSIANWTDSGVGDVDLSLSSSVVSNDDRFRFGCARDMKCSQACCSNVRILLPPYDLLRIRRRLSVSLYDFMESYGQVNILNEIGLPVISLRIREDSRKSCIFLCDDGCAIYSDRPSICRYYPVIPRRQLGLEKEGPDYHFAKWHNCLGLHSEKEWSVREWRALNEITLFDCYNDKWKEVISTLSYLYSSRKFQHLSNEGQSKLFFLASYDWDGLIGYVEENSLDQINLRSTTMESGLEHDMSRTLNALQWMAYSITERR